MDLQLTEDQAALVAAVQAILHHHAELPQDERFSFAWHDNALQSQLEDNGFLDAARSIGALEAALVTHEVAKGVSAIETIGRGLVAPLACPDDEVHGPVALVTEDGLGKAIRNLPIARTLLVDRGDDVALIVVEPDDIEPVESIFAYPYGRFRRLPDLSAARCNAGAGAAMRQWWRVGLAAEITGAADAAIAFTIDYVKQREVFGRPVGSFQSVQHRLVQRHGHAKASYYLAMRAAWSGDPADADIAACHVQQGLQALMFDLHQFHGGMGVTTEHLLHFWLYRVRALQAEAGGIRGSSLAIADRRWGEQPATSVGQPVRMVS